MATKHKHWIASSSACRTEEDIAWRNGLMVANFGYSETNFSCYQKGKTT
jgi:hypothetical protein